MRIAMMGGTMDPVHNGHIEIAIAVRDALNCDEAVLLPAGDPPHKTPHTDKWHRLAMVRLAAEDAGLTCSDVEVTRRTTTYTVDTLTEYAAAHPEDEIYYIVGGDTVPVIETWRRFADAAKLCTFAVVGRPGDSGLAEAMEAVSARTGARFIAVNAVGPDISSTMIRERAAAGKCLKGLVPKPVRRYIEENHLYRPFTVAEMTEKLRYMLPEKRFTHSIGVMETAVRLAHVAGADVEKARIAGLLHDCAKKLDADETAEALERGSITLYEGEAENAPVLHAPAGAYIASHVFGIQDREILSAIRLHTVGAPEMTPLEALIYTADFIEPNRKPIPNLDVIREAAENDVYRAATMCALSTRRHVESCGQAFCGQTRRMLEYYETIYGGDLL